MSDQKELFSGMPYHVGIQDKNPFLGQMLEEQQKSGALSLNFIDQDKLIVDSGSVTIFATIESEQIRLKTKDYTGVVKNLGSGAGGGSGSAETNLSTTLGASSVTINSDTGNSALIPSATTTLAGVLSASDKVRLNSLSNVALSGNYSDLNGLPTLGTLSSQNNITSSQISDSSVVGRNILTASSSAQQRTLLSLNNVDNTSDLNKPVSTATQTALNSKQDTLVSGTNIRTINGQTLLGSGDLVISGSAGSGSTGNFFLETASGSVNGSNTIFRINNSPTTAPLVFINGLLQVPVTDYNISGSSILFTSASVPQTGDFVTVSYGVGISPSGTGSIVVQNNGNLVSNNASILNFTGSGVSVTGGSLVTVNTSNLISSAVTSSMSVLSASFALTASFALNAGGGSFSNLTPVAGQTYWEYEEFLSGTTALKANLASSTAGGTITSLVAGDFSAVHDSAQVMGVSRFATGAVATASQRAAVIAPATAGMTGLWFNNGYSARLVLKVGNFINPLDPVTNTGHIILGFANGTTSRNPGNAVAFISADGGNFIATTVRGNSATTTDTGIAPSSGSAFRIFDISVNATATEAIYRVDGNVVATHTTNIPNTRTNAMGICLCIFRSPANAYNSSFDIDSLVYGVTRTTPLFS